MYFKHYGSSIFTLVSLLFFTSPCLSQLEKTYSDALNKQLFEGKVFAFEPDKWKKRLMRENGMVHDLIHSYPIIGMQRERLYALLGNPDQVLDSSKNGSDVYLLTTRPHCGNAGNDSLEIAYLNNYVHRLRLAYEEGIPMIRYKSKKVVRHTYYSRWLEANPSKDKTKVPQM